MAGISSVCGQVICILFPVQECRTVMQFCDKDREYSAKIPIFAPQNNGLHVKAKHAIWLFFIALMVSCSATKFVPDGQYMLDKVVLKSDDKHVDVTLLEPYIRQKANSKWFSVFKIPLGTYAMAGKDTTKWINRTLQRIGEQPVIYDTLQANLSCEDLRKALQNQGYMNASVKLKAKAKNKKVKVTYHLNPGSPFFIGRVRYDIQDRRIDSILRPGLETSPGLRAGQRFTVPRLDQERKRITTFLGDLGYYRFHKDFIMFTADSVEGGKIVDLTMHITGYRKSGSDVMTEHPYYQVRNVYFSGGDSTDLHLRKKVIENNCAIEAGKPYSGSDLQRTYNNFGRLQAVRYTNIRFEEVPDSNQLDCYVQLSTNKPNTISFQPEGTNTAGDLGAAASLTYENRNLFRGSELLSVKLRAAFEAITGLEGYRDQNYVEYNAETKLTFPHFLAPFLSRRFQRRQTATTEFAIAYDLQNRPEFHRRVFSTTWRYRWSNPTRKTSYRFDLIDLNYVYMPWISETFKHDYLDSVSNRNAILRYNYEDLFIMKTGFGISYSNGQDAVRANVETSGNLLYGLSHAFNMKKNDEGQYTLFNIAYAQYVKFDIDYTRLIAFDPRNALALHAAFGIAWPYGNSDVLPFEKRYFSGGANSVRGWSVRELGPGKFKGTNGAIDFINQTGDLKLDMSVEYRTRLFWKIFGAAFVDAGNIWTLRAYDEQPGGQFKWGSFYEQIAVSYGLGIRLNLDYFIIRLDGGMKAINPAYDTQKEHYAVFHPDFSRDFSFHFAVGLPF